MANSDSQIEKPQCVRPKRNELPDVNINTGAVSNNSERTLTILLCVFIHHPALRFHSPSCFAFSLTILLCDFINHPALRFHHPALHSD